MRHTVTNRLVSGGIPPGPTPSLGSHSTPLAKVAFARTELSTVRYPIRDEEEARAPSVADPRAGLAYSRSSLLSSYGLISGCAALLAVSALVAAYHQEDWEYPVMRALNAFARRSVSFDRAMHALTTRDLLQGVPLLGLIWFLWFSDEDASRRRRLIAGTVAASLAGLLSRAIQLLLPTHLRPLHQPHLGFVLPFGVQPDYLNHFNAFPSDHGAVYFALAAVIWQAAPRLGGLAFIWAAIIDLARVYEGYHFPSDVTGSIGLGLTVFCLFQTAATRFPVSRVLAFEQRRRPWFYMAAFVFTYLLATLFDDLRELCRGVAAVLLHHDVFNGP